MEELFYATIVYSGLGSSLFLILTKYRVIQYLQANGRFGINKAANCHFCCCFWICFIISVIGLILGGQWITLIASLSGASIMRAIIN